MLNAIGDSFSDRASSNDKADGEDEYTEEDTMLGKLSKEDESGRVTGTIAQMVEQHLEGTQWKQMRIDKLRQPRWGDMADYFGEEDMKKGIAELKVPAVIKPQTDMFPAIPAPTRIGDFMETLDIIPRISQMQQGTSPLGCSHTRLDSGKLR